MHANLKQSKSEETERQTEKEEANKKSPTPLTKSLLGGAV